MWLRLVIGLGATAIAFAIAGRRVWWLYRLVSSGQPVTDRTHDIGGRLKAELGEVIGQQRLLRWSVPGLAHAFTFWGFLVLGLTIVEAYGALFDKDFHIPLIGRWGLIAFLEDFFAVAVLAGLATFAILRRRQDPAKIDRSSRFYGSHLGAAWQILGMIFLVILTLLVYRGAQINTGVFPFGDTWWAFASKITAEALAPLGHTANEVIETVFVLGQILVIMALPGHHRLLQAPAHRARADQRRHQTAALGSRSPTADRVRRQAGELRGPGRGRHIRPRARSRTSPGRACSTSPPAPSAVGASRSARPGTPANRCRPSS